MKIEGTVALVTGSSRGIGKNFVKALITRGAKKVYASARDPSKVADLVAAHPGKVVALQLDITNDAQVAAAAKACKDVTLLVNNAGINLKTGIIAGKSADNARAEFNTNFFGTFAVSRAFAPILGDRKSTRLNSSH